MNELFPWALPRTLRRTALFLVLTAATLGLYSFGIAVGVLLAVRLVLS